MSDVKQLNGLQELDIEIADAEKSLSDVLAKLADHSELSSARQQAQQLESRLDELTTRRGEVERKVAGLQETVEKLDSRLYGGGVTNPQQLAAAEEEHNYTQGRQRESEDELLDLMVASEEVEPALAEARDTLSRLEASRPSEEAAWRDTESRLREKLAALGRSREEVRPLIPAPLLPLYESLRKSRSGRAVARVERGMCQGCRLALPTMEVQRARSSQGIVQCSSCGRILYAD